MSARSLLTALALLVAVPAHATHHGIEELFGATNIHAAFGNGVITAAWSDLGELTVLRWPNPTFNEHMHYQTAGGEDGYTLQFMGAAENDGGFDGVIVGNTGDVSWLRDSPWVREITYAAKDVDVLTRAYSHGERKVTCTELVQGKLPVLRRRCVLEGPEVHTYVGYLNPALMTEHKAFEPTTQTMNDDVREAELRWDADNSAFIDKADGVVLVVGVDPKPEQIHCGRDNGLEPGDAYLEIKGNTAVQGPENLAYRVAAKEVETLIVFGATEEEALAALETARATSFEDAQTEREATDRAWLAEADLPDIADPDHLAFIHRTLLSIRTGTDLDTGAIVASVSSQPPYNLDWPRDGSFFNLFLSDVGHHDRVAQHNRFYADVQRKDAGQDAALRPDLAHPGSFAMNYYADGQPGGFIDFEIDQVGLTLWTMATHTADDDTLWPAITLAADLLTKCKDEASGLQCKANEDDNPGLTQTLHGAITVWLGLKAAAAAAKTRNDPKAEDWQARQLELEQAIRDRWITDTGIETDDHGALSWAAYPAKFQFTEAAKQALIAKLLHQLDISLKNRNPPGSAYDAKLTLALAYLLPPDSPNKDDRQRLEAHIEILAKEVPTENNHMGEVYIPDEFGTDWRNHTAMPHIWEATLVALTLMMLHDHPDYDPTATEDPPPDDDTPPDTAAPPEDDSSSDCAAGTTPGPGSAGASVLLLLLLMAGILRMARRKPL